MSLMLTEKALDADPRQLDLVDWQPVHGECFNGCRVTDLLQEAAAADRPQTKQEPGHWR